VSILNPLFDAVAWVMMRIHAALAVPFGASSGVTWALSIIILVVLMRLVMVPLFIKQRNSMQKMQSHMPHLQELRKKYKNDKTRLNEETMKFYKENGINPLGGCLPLVAQLPVFWSLFNVLRAIAQWKPGTTPAYGMTVPFVESAHEARIFGISLYDQFLHPVTGESLTSRLLIVVFVLISAATTFLTMRQSQRRGMMNQTAPDPDQPGAAAAASMSKNMMYIAPFFALTGLYWQFGLVLYWVTTNVWTLGQQHFLFRRLPVVGSATVGASAAPAAAGAGTAARAVPAKTGTGTAKSGTVRTGPAKAGPAKPNTTKGAAPARAAAARNGVSSASGGGAKAGAKSTDAKSATAPKAGAPRPAAAKAAAAKAADAKPAGVKATARPAEASAASAEPQDTVPVQDTPPAQKSNGNGAAAGSTSNGSGTGNGSGMLRRFTRAKEEPQEVPAAPQTKVVRQQPTRQTRSKRGNTGKR
jgi:YidC/Oxa1 family membrane protein insertase